MRCQPVRRRQFLLVTSGALAACGLPAVRPPAPPTLADRLRGLAVRDDDFYRPVLYSWTSVDAITKLRASKKLLVAMATDGGFTSAFLQRLAAIVRARDEGRELADLLLTHPSLIRRRYAWTAPFATVMGMGKRTYGTSLIQIDLRPEAWMGRFDPEAAQPLTFVDAAGREVGRDDVLARPERIGAIFHLHPDPAFREYVVCSEAMVATWSIATPAIRAKLATEVALLRDLRDHGAFAPGTTERPASTSWRQEPANDLTGLWHATLAFDNDRYHARRGQLDAILDALAAYDPAGEPLVVSPNAAAYSARSASHSSSSAT
jgi:hypothetical protein